MAPITLDMSVGADRVPMASGEQRHGSRAVPTACRPGYYDTAGEGGDLRPEHVHPNWSGHPADHVWGGTPLSERVWNGLPWMWGGTSGPGGVHYLRVAVNFLGQPLPSWLLMIHISSLV
jgi:hypothetical protein